MSYTPTTWECGDVVTAEKLNKIEQGIADSGGGTSLAPFVVNATYDSVNQTYIPDKTLAETLEAIEDGRTVLFRDEEMGHMAYGSLLTYTADNGGSVSFFGMRSTSGENWDVVAIAWDSNGFYTLIL